ncbi:MAG: bifunctional phosphopantothenoylcysteine decarboxylase/phosphopantothenate--cysteine ligase CoaBC [Anaerolineaceae bacterium]|nr:bifunctional phosphopantothenoylcysteine decarboxylase/phosphopantothenate--cysteine ligase CoaBC [Anaerolineaceae bacterium]
MSNPFAGKTIILGITGSIAAYKGADLASKLHQAGAVVDVVLTQGALHFIHPLTFQSVTSRKAYTDQDLWGGEGHVAHITLGRSADLILVAPASASTISKLASGQADNLLVLAHLASDCPLLLAPAMDGGMYAHPATQANLELLRQRGAHTIGPASGHLASGLVGPGRMVEPLEILGFARYVLSRGGPLARKKIVVTAGGTQEPIDPVRFISNRSSGKQGFALAQAAIDAGADVTLITGPNALPTPGGAHRLEIHTAAEMLAVVLRETAGADALLMAAAVADFRPADFADQKIKKQSGFTQLNLAPTTDILAEVAARRTAGEGPRCVVGFAAESQDLLHNAQSKLQAKHLDMIVANDISAKDAGFEVDTNRVTLLFAGGRQETLPLLSKQEVADRIMEQIVQWLLA